MSDIRVSGLAVYPFKSMMPKYAERVLVGTTGLAVDNPDWVEGDAPAFLWDREFMLVDSEGVAITQRQAPRLAVVEARFEDHGVKFVDHGADKEILGNVGYELGPQEIAYVDLKSEVPATVQEMAQGDVTGLSELLGKNVRVMRADNSSPRYVFPDFRIGSPDNVIALMQNQTALADVFPIHSVNEASLDALNRFVDSPGWDIPINRFRPNIIISGLPAFDEEFIRKIKIGEMTGDFVIPTPRCPIPDVDQETGEKVGGVTKPLIDLRSGSIAVGGKEKKGRFFGQYVSHSVLGQTMIQVGMPVEVLERGTTRNFEPAERSSAALERLLGD